MKVKTGIEERLAVIENASDKPAVVVFSGGQDSTTCLLLAKKYHKEVYAINFAYEQRHKAEVDAAKKIASMLDVPLASIKVDFMKHLVTSALLHKGDINGAHPHNKNLPASFVPGRNALFFTIAHSYAQELSACAIYTGVCETDYSGYPDCRNEFITMLEKTLNTGYETNIAILTPLMWLDKADTFRIADELGALSLIVDETQTCYKGETRSNIWGRGCSTCPACKLRKDGYFKAFPIN